MERAGWVARMTGCEVKQNIWRYVGEVFQECFIFLTRDFTILCPTDFGVSPNTWLGFVKVKVKQFLNMKKSQPAIQKAGCMLSHNQTSGSFKIFLQGHWLMNGFILSIYTSRKRFCLIYIVSRGNDLPPKRLLTKSLR